MPEVDLSHPNSILFCASWNKEQGKAEFSIGLPPQTLLSIEELEILGHCILRQAEEFRNQSLQ